MPIKPHPRFSEIKRVLQKFAQRGKPFAAVCYRCVEPKFADQVIAGLGSRMYGARWTPKNSFPTVYLCETAEAALQEYLARGRRMKIPDHKSLPMMMLSVKVKVANLLDLTEKDTAIIVNTLLETEKAHWRAIQDRREAVSQAIGRAIEKMGFSGLAAPSQACPGQKNIAIFPQNLSPKETLNTPSLKPI
ncbi:MAG TPA: RES family NAD+ phosphorylase [Pseudomonadales bacterium]|nr:RES family NAD+ phosphorylase [Pseudomonadales bacterium]